MNSTSSKPTITLFTSVEGHLSIAQAIEQVLQNKYSVQMYVQRDSLYSVYLPIYRHAPYLFKFIYNLGKSKVLHAFAQKSFQRKYDDIVDNFNQKYAPKLCISVYFMYNPSLEKYQQEHNVKFLNVIPDPRTANPLLISSEADQNLIFDEAHQKECLKLKPRARYSQVGWFVRDEYQPAKSKKVAKEKLGLDPQKLTFLITSGSEGTTLITSILPSLLETQASLQIIVSCGNNKELLKNVEALAQQTKTTAAQVNITALPFTRELYKYMQAADLVIGKAGPNTIFEAAATLTPFFAITHISGQEDGNLDIIRERNLGYIEEDPAKAALLVREIVAHPEQLKQFDDSLKAVAEYNQHAKKKLLTIVESLTKTV